MNVLVIGGGGFVGSHVVDRLVAEGHSVTILGRGTSGGRSTIFNPGVEDRITAIQGKMSDSVLMAELLNDCDLVYHFASSTVPATSNVDPVGDIDSNMVGTIKLLDAMRSAGVSRIVYLSSGGTVYGNKSCEFLSEEMMPEPISSYGIVKVAIEHYLNMYAAQYGIQPTILRLSNPYGPRQKHAGMHGLITTLLGNVVSNRVTKIWGNGSAVRDYIYIDEVADLVAGMVELNPTGVYNIGSGSGASVMDVVEIISDVCHTDVRIEHMPERKFDVSRVVLDISKAEQRLGWRPATTLQHGIRNTWNAFRHER